MQAIGNHVIVLLDEQDSVTPGGIVLPEGAKEK